MAENVQESSVMNPVESVEYDQSSMVDDALDGIDTRSDEELVDQQTGEPVRKPNAEKAKTEQTQTEKKPEQQDGEKPVDDKSEKPAEKYKPKNDLEKSFFGEDGAFNHDAARDFLKKSVGFQYQRETPKEQKDANGKPQELDTRPKYMKDLEEEKKYRTNLEGNLMKTHTRIRELVGQGYSVEQAVSVTEAENRDILYRTYQERDWENREKFAQSQLEEQKRIAEESSYKPRSETNQSEVARELGGMDKYQQLMFSPEYGGPVIQMLFDIANPDNKSLGDKEYSSSLSDWWVKFSAQSPNNVKFVASLAKARLQESLWPHLVTKISTNAVTQERQASRKMTAPSNLSRTPAREGSKNSDSVSDYFGTDAIDEI